MCALRQRAGTGTLGWETIPAIMPLASIPPSQCKWLGISDGLVRLSVGVAAIDDLRGELAEALA